MNATSFLPSVFDTLNSESLPATPYAFEISLHFYIYKLNEILSS